MLDRACGMLRIDLNRTCRKPSTDQKSKGTRKYSDLGALANLQDDSSAFIQTAVSYFGRAWKLVRKDFRSVAKSEVGIEHLAPADA